MEDQNLTSDYSSITLTSQDQASSTLTGLDHYYRCGYFCDLRVQCYDGEGLNVHRVILAVSSSYVHSLLSHQPHTHLIHLDIPVRYLELIVKFIYSGNVRLPSAHVPYLMNFASFLQVPGLVRLCEDFIANIPSSLPTGFVADNTTTEPEKKVMLPGPSDCNTNAAIDTEPMKNTFPDYTSISSSGRKIPRACNREDPVEPTLEMNKRRNSESGSSVGGDGDDVQIKTEEDHLENEFEEQVNLPTLHVVEDNATTKSIRRKLKRKPVGQNTKVCAAVKYLAHERGVRNLLLKHETFPGHRHSFTCKLCLKKFALLSQMRVHIMQEHGKKSPCICNLEFSTALSHVIHKRKCALQKANRLPTQASISCDYCRTKFLYLKSLRKHLRNVHKKVRKYTKRKLGKRKKYPEGKTSRRKGWWCEEPECGGRVRYQNSVDLLRHMRQQHPQMVLTCPHERCKFNTRLQKLLERHLRKRHGSRQHMCEVCGRSFTSVHVLKSHRFARHDLKDDSLKIYRCEFPGCDYATPRKDGIPQHMVRHKTDKPYTCQVCCKKLKTEKTLEKHVARMHLGMRPYICDQCGQAFIEEVQLRYHMKRHNAVKEHACEHCNFATHDSANYKMHLFSRHGIRHAKLRVLNCSLCPYITTVKARLRDHQNSHAKLRNIPCTQCHKRFMSKNALRGHIAKVHNPKKFQCNLCTFRSSTQFSLQEHQRVVHIHPHVKPYKCVHCDFCSAIGGNCRKHIMRKHPGLEVRYIKLTDEQCRM